MKKLARNTLLAFVLGAFVMLMVTPLATTAHAAQSAKVTVKSYDMDEYLDMLLETGQYEKYDRFVQIASPEAYAQHIARYNTWVNGYPAYVWGNGDPVAFVKARAYALGFNPQKDTFTLVYQRGSKAVVKVLHGGKRYYVTVERSYSPMYVISSVRAVK